MNNKNDYTFNIALIGDSLVGKSSFINRLINDDYSSIYNRTIGANCHIINKKINTKNIELQIWDTSGEACFDKIKTMFYKDVNMIVLFFNISDITTFKNTKKYIADIMSIDRNKMIIIVGSMCDSPRMVSYADAVDIGKTYVEISALKNIGINSLITTIISELKHNRDKLLFGQ